jgi:ATP-binding cassette subfamily F protein 3
LAGLSFAPEDLERDCEEFSGGWQMRIALAKLLLAEPDVLLLDEPTNHLDLEARNWLEDFLRQYAHTCLLVSHDRYFLDAIVERIAELAHGRLNLYAGNYTAYLKQKEQRLEILQAAWQNQQQKRHQLEVFINRFRYQATKASQVQSRIKELERMEKIELPPGEEPIHFRFPQPRPSGRRVIELRAVSKHYGAKRVFDGIDLVLERGERVALVGPNGAGKSTLLKLLAAVEPPTGGERKLGHEVAVDYFAQDQYRALDPEKRILDDLGAISPTAMVPQLRNLLGCFLFRGDDVFKRIGVLSGGERNRYALARMLLTPANLLLLDEPTNHLDLQAKDVLLEALQQFTGTVVFVSHDRYFIDALANKVIEVGGGHAVVYLGNYEDYRYRKEHAGEAAPVRDGSASPNGLQSKPGTSATDARAPASNEKRRRVNPQRQLQMRQAVESLEEQIARVEAEIKDLEAAMAQQDTFKDAVTAQQVVARYDQQREQRAALVARWEEQIAALQAQNEA